jgi:predicted Zn-dependent peptidase
VTVAKDKYDQRGRSLLDKIESDVAGAFEGLSSFSSQPNTGKRLDSIKSQLRYDILAGLNSPQNIAQNFALNYRFTRDPQVYEKIAGAIVALRPADIEAFARKYFKPENRVTVTLSGKGGAQ